MGLISGGGSTGRRRLRPPDATARQTPPLRSPFIHLKLGLLTRSLGRGQSLVLYGRTRTGKTTLARSLGKHLYFGGLFSGGVAAGCDADVRYAVLDDIRGGIKFFPGFKDWLGCQSNFMVKQLYREPKLISWGRPSIWCSNVDPRADCSPEDHEWLEGNCLFVHVDELIFIA